MNSVRVSEKAVFSKISHQEERDKLFRDLTNAKAKITVKIDEEILELKPQGIKPPHLECSVVKSGDFKFTDRVGVIGNFALGGERYFFKTSFKVMMNEVLLDTSGDLYHLQRRDNYRVIIPESYGATFELKTHNEDVFSQKLRIADLSAGGCKLMTYYFAPEYAVDDIISGTINIKGVAPLEIRGKIKHRIIKEIEGRDFQIFGVEFIPQKISQDSYLFTIVMDLHRAINSPWR